MNPAPNGTIPGPFLACFRPDSGHMNLAASHDNPTPPAVPAKTREVFILGVTTTGRTFRPSDWAERLCGVLSPYRPEGYDAAHAHIGYSPYVRPTIVNGSKCVIVDERLHDIEPMAWDFVIGFAKDNDLQTFEACELPAPSR